MRQVPYHYAIVANHIQYYLLQIPFSHWHRQTSYSLTATIKNATHSLLLIKDSAIETFWWLTCQKIEQKPPATGFIVDYVAEHNQRRFAAVKLGNVRLIDNIVLTELKEPAPCNLYA